PTFDLVEMKEVPAMKLDFGKLATASAVAWAVWYSLCALLVALAPAQTQGVFSYVLHYDLSGGRRITWGSYCVGVVATRVWVAFVILTVGWVLNIIDKPSVASSSRPATERGIDAKVGVDPAGSGST